MCSRYIDLHGMGHDEYQRKRWFDNNKMCLLISMFEMKVIYKNSTGNKSILCFDWVFLQARYVPIGRSRL